MIKQYYSEIVQESSNSKNKRELKEDKMDLEINLEAMKTFLHYFLSN